VLFLLLGGVAVAFAAEPRQGPAGPLDFTPAGTQPGLQAPMEPPTDCGFCHEGNEGADETFMPFPTWAGSLMANAARDPLFWAALDVANRDAPGVGDFCLRCHAPTGWLGGRVRKTGTPTLVNGENGCLLTGDLDDADNYGNDFAGLTCHTCHRLMAEGPAGQTTTRHNADYWIDDAVVCFNPDGGSFFGPCRRGPYSYAPGGPVGAPPHGWQYSVFHTTSELCGTCHDVSSPVTSAGPFRTLILPDGTDTGRPFPVERTFSEWRQSDQGDVLFADGFATGEPAPPRLRRGQSCQDCHMRVSSHPSARACVFNSPGARANNLPVHELAGGNTWIPQVLKAEYPGLNRAAAFDRTTLLARELLTQQSASIETTLDPFTPGDMTLTARVRVTNRTGHKLPTGYSEGRRMWIGVQARDGQGALIFESAAYDAATGTLTRDAQAKVYEVRQGEWNAQARQCRIRDGQGREVFHFVLGNCVALDNRIPPLGFRGGADMETRPVGYAYPETSPGSGRLVNFDVTAYAIPVAPGTPLPITVTATLRYQTASREYLEFLRDVAAENSLPSEDTLCGRSGTVGPRTRTRGQFAYDLWAASGRSAPEAMAASSAATGS
jgi:hypothetical protein